MTSQSITIWRSPSAARSVTARSERPIRRWISWVRPDCLPAAASRRIAFMGGARQHAVFGRDPALAGTSSGKAAPVSSRLAVHKHMGVAEFDEAGALGMLGDAGFEA